MILRSRNALNTIPLPLLLLTVASLRLPAQPVITSQPTDQTVAIGGNAMFSVVATGAGPLTYQWQFNGTNLPNNIITTVAGGGIGNGNSGNGGPATNASLNSPQGLAMDASGSLFVADIGNSIIRKIDTNGIITRVAGKLNTTTYSGDGGAATNAGLSNPYGVAVDSQGNLFISDRGHNVIRKVDTNGIITTIAGIGPNSGTSGDGGAATNAYLNIPNGLAIDSVGNLYIADDAFTRVRRVDTNGIITRVAGGGGNVNDGGQATNAFIASANGLSLDPAGNIFISGGTAVRKIDTNGIITTVAGRISQPFGFSGDGGAATNAQLNLPYFTASDSADRLFIADSNNHRVRLVDSNGIINTMVGNGSLGFSGDGGPATNAALSTPSGVVFDSAGNLLIADNNRIRKVAFGGMPTRTLSNVGKNNAGSYQVIVTSPSGSVTSSVAMLLLPPQIQANDSSFGVQSNFFGFNLTGISNQVVVIEASTNLAASSWVALQTNILGTNAFYFSDSQWTNYPGRFYRLRSP
jgi:hypothetical protein